MHGAIDGKISFSKCARHTGQRDIIPCKSEFLAYLQRKAQKGPSSINPDEFLNYWKNLDQYDLGENELILTLQYTRQSLTERGNFDKAACYFYDGFFKDWYEKVYALPSRSPRLMCNALRDFSRFSIEPDKKFMDLWDNISAKKIFSFTEDELEISLHAFAKLGIMPKAGFVKDWMQAADSKLRYFTASQLSSILWSVSVFASISGTRLYKPFADSLMFELSKKELNPSQHSEASFSSILFNIPFRRTTIQNHKQQSSRWENELQIAFNNAGFIQSARSTTIDALKRNVDFRFDRNGKDIIVEADGPAHFIKNNSGGFHFNGSTILQTALLQTLFPDSIVIRLPYNEKEIFRKLHPGDPTEYMLEALDKKLATTKPGSYQMTAKYMGVNLIPFFNERDNLEKDDPRPLTAAATRAHQYSAVFANMRRPNQSDPQNQPI